MQIILEFLNDFLSYINLNCELSYACLVLIVEQNFLQTNNEQVSEKIGRETLFALANGYVGLHMVQMTIYKSECVLNTFLIRLSLVPYPCIHS